MTTLTLPTDPDPVGHAAAKLAAMLADPRGLDNPSDRALMQTLALAVIACRLNDLSRQGHLNVLTMDA